MIVAEIKMHVFEYLANTCQPNYKSSVLDIIIEFSQQLDLHAFDDIELKFLPTKIIEQIELSNIDPMIKVHLLSGLMNLDWWSDIDLSDQNKSDISRLARKELFKLASQFTNLPSKSNDLKKERHAVFVGQIVHLLHSPTRGALDYIRALSKYKKTKLIDVFYTGNLTSEIKIYADEIIGDNKYINYINISTDADWLESAIQNGPYTYHFFCEPHLSVQIGIMSLFGPSIMLTTGHIAPIQYADIYWYNHDAEYIESLWGRTGAPKHYIENYKYLRSAPIFIPQANQIRSRKDVGFSADDIVLTSVGNRLGTEITEEFIDGLCPIILNNPKVRWLAIGPLQDYWIDTFNSVLGSQFVHIPYDQDLPSLMKNVDIFVNSFRAGGGMSAAIAIDSGAVFLGRGDFGDTMALAPHAHRQNSVSGYFEKLQELIDNPVLRKNWVAEQKSYLNIYADPNNFRDDLKYLIDIAHARYDARLPISIEKIYDQ
jgi:hypothetical protein